MEKYQRVLTICGGISLFVFLIFGLTTALLTDMDKAERIFTLDASHIDIAIHVDELSDYTKIDPGKEFNIVPWIENKGSSSMYVFMEIDIPLVDNTPIFNYEPNEEWVLVKTEYTDNYKKDVYNYGNLLPVSSMTPIKDYPLMRTATFNRVSSSYSRQFTLTIKAYAATTGGFTNDMEPIDVWKATVTAAGE